MKKWQFILSAFAGGTVLSIMELYSMFQHKELPDMFFFGGMFIAGVIGIVGYIISKSASKTEHSIVNAFMSGIAAPQFLSGLVKVGATTAQTASLLFLPTTVYAQPIDSIQVIAIIQGIDSAELQIKDKSFKINEVSKLIIPRQDSITIVGNGFFERIPVPNKKERRSKKLVRENISA